MKLYITNIPPSAIRNNQDKLTPFLFNKREIHEIYSEDYGLHIIDLMNKNQVYKVEAQFETDYHLIKGHQYNNNNQNNKDPSSCDLLFDLTVYQNVLVVSQLPVKYILTKIQRFSYKLNKKSNWTLIIDSIRETNPETMDKELIPINYYFEYLDNKNQKTNNINKKEFKETMDELLFQDEINMFLSHLI